MAVAVRTRLDKRAGNPQPPWVDMAWKLFLTSKPYSYVAESARGALFALLVGPGSSPAVVWCLALQSLAAWFYFNWQSDLIQASKGRVLVSSRILAVPAIVAIASGWYTGGPVGGFGFVVYALTIVGYSPKSRSRRLGPWGPALRVLTILGQFAMVSCAVGIFPDRHAIWAAVSIALAHGAKNLVGDVRDVRSDRWEFPVQYGPKPSLFLAEGVTLLSTVPLLLVDSPVNWVLFISAIASMTVVACCVFLCGLRFAHKWGYLAHWCLSLAAPAAYLAALWAIGAPAAPLIAAGAVSLILHATYHKLKPGLYPRRTELFDGS